MVDALCEARRVLIPRGICVDTRPVSAPVRIEAVTAARSSTIAIVDSYGAVEDDNSAEAAVRHALSSGWFLRERGHRFDFEVYCDSGADLRTYAQSGRRLRDAAIDYHEAERRRRQLAAETGLRSRLCCHRPATLHVYRKPGIGR